MAAASLQSGYPIQPIGAYHAIPPSVSHSAKTIASGFASDQQRVPSPNKMRLDSDDYSQATFMSPLLGPAKQQQQQAAQSASVSDADRDLSKSSTESATTTASIASTTATSVGDNTSPSDTSKPVLKRSTKGKYTLADFSIRRTLGTGSFGRVHLVQSRHNEKFYAVKVLKKYQVVKMKQVEHTNSEKAMLERVRHPFLVNLWGTFQDTKNLYMVMDFVEGGELFSLLRKSQRFPNPVAKFYAAEVALALDYLHQQNIIYRDLKPENLLLDRNGHIKITDFGFAKYVPDITWTLCGTPDYLAPEVVSSKGYNKSVDWWSLGVLAFEMLAGYPPFYDSDPIRLYEKILACKIRYPGYFDPLAKDLLKNLLTADLTKRFGNLRNGSRDIMDHQWFKEVNWQRLARKEIEAPYVPPVTGDGDASLFDYYPEEGDAEFAGARSGEGEAFEGLFPEF